MVESPGLSLGLTGDLPATRLHGAKDAGIFELKGVVESLLSLFAVSPDALNASAAEGLTFSPDAPAWIEPGRGATALLDGAAIACFGELAATEREARKLRQQVYLAEIDVVALYRLPLRRTTARELSRFQAVERDFSFTFADAVQWRAIAESVAALAIPELTRVAPVEIFRDAKASTVPAGHFALLLRCVFQSNQRTPARRGVERLVGAAYCGADGAGRDDSHVNRPHPTGFAWLCKVSAVRNPHYTASMSSGVSVDEFQALEQKVLRAVEIVKREREAARRPRLRLRRCANSWRRRRKAPRARFRQRCGRRRLLRARSPRWARNAKRFGCGSKRCCSKWTSCCKDGRARVRWRRQATFPTDGTR